jgi:hypothetical protein
MGSLKLVPKMRVTTIFNAEDYNIPATEAA